MEVVEKYSLIIVYFTKEFLTPTEKIGCREKFGTLQEYNASRQKKKTLIKIFVFVPCDQSSFQIYRVANTILSFNIATSRFKNYFDHMTTALLRQSFNRTSCLRKLSWNFRRFLENIYFQFIDYYRIFDVFFGFQISWQKKSGGDESGLLGDPINVTSWIYLSFTTSILARQKSS